MRQVLNQLRMLLAESMFGWCVALAPKDNEDGKRMVQAIADYFRGCKKP